MSRFYPTQRQREANEYFASLSERDRKAKAKRFHSFVLTKHCNKKMSHSQLLEIFNEFCNVFLDDRPGPTCMRFRSYLFLLKKLSALEEETTFLEERRYTILSWPKELSAREQLMRYMSAHQFQTTNMSTGTQSLNKSPSLAQTIVSLINHHREALMSDKCEVQVTSSQDAKIRFPPVVIRATVGRVIATAAKPESIDIEILNKSKLHSKKLLRCGFIDPSSCFVLEDSMHISSGFTSSAKLLPGTSYVVTCTFAPKHIGVYKGTLAFELQDGESGNKFHIIRFVSGSAQASERDMRLVQPKSQYVPFNPKPRRKGLTIIDGERPPGPHHKIPMVRELAEYRIPPEINEHKINEKVLEELTADLQNSHSKRFHTLLHIEEKQMYRDIRRYDRKKELSQTPGGYLTLKVEGLAESRPSLLKGDHILATWESHHYEYKGYVHRVYQEEVWLKFHPSFHKQFIRGQKYDIRFTFNRLPLRLQHRALDLSDKTLPRELLFPTINAITTSSIPVLWNPKTKPLTFYDRDVESNREQGQAVEMIVSGHSRPAPYLIFGPPGTGKTKTTVEAMKQVLKCIPESRILACAPSNSATDLLCERLLTHVPKDQVLRLNAFSRPRSTDIPGTVMEVSCYDDDTGSFEMPQLAKLKQYRVILSTLITAGRLVSISLPSNHFSHIFIDESGHAVEPECLVPVAGLLNTDNPKGGQLVLAGDPKQLGPVLRSHIAIKHGLQTSLLERLMTQCDVYQRKSSSHYNPHVLTKLLQNYRSHPDILCIPNETFYNNELKVKADPLVRTSLCKWEHLPKQDFPIIFHGIEGEDQREENSPSFFNPQEAIVVHSYIAQLIESREIRVNAREIGVISPYRKQVEKIRTVLRAKGFESVKVGSVEEFQGQERRIIIISTVRSNPTFLAMDRDYKLGFLDNPKRFNVAITRAKALLVVVGNPKLLSRDKNWNTFLQFVCRKGGYVGIEFKDVSVADQALLDRIQELELHREDTYTASAGEQDNEPTSSETEWRKEE